MKTPIVKTRHWLWAMLSVAAYPPLWRTNTALAVAFAALWIVIALDLLLHRDPVIDDIVYLSAFVLFIFSAFAGRYFDVIRLSLMLFVFVRELFNSRNWFKSLFVIGLVLSISPVALNLGVFSIDYALFGYGLMLLAYLMKTANAYDILIISVLSGLILGHLFMILYLIPVLSSFLMILIVFSKPNKGIMLPLVFIGAPVLAALALLDMWKGGRFTPWIQFSSLVLWMVVVVSLVARRSAPHKR